MWVDGYWRVSMVDGYPATYCENGKLEFPWEKDTMKKKDTDNKPEEHDDIPEHSHTEHCSPEEKTEEENVKKNDMDMLKRFRNMVK